MASQFNLKYIARTIGLLVLSSCSTVEATTHWQPLVTLTAGAAFNNDTGNSQYFPSPNPVQDAYYNYAANNSQESVLLVGGFIGAERKLARNWNIQLGLGYYQPGIYHAKGTLTQGPAIIGSGAPDIDASSQYPYRYNIKTQQLLVESKLLFTTHNIFHPYITAGIGAGFNNVYGFSADITPVDTTLTNHFNSANTTSFSYRVGFGIDVDLTKQVRLGLGYRFADFGSTKSGTSVIDSGGINNDGTVNPAVTSNNRLTQSHLYTNDVVAQLTYLI